MFGDAIVFALNLANPKDGPPIHSPFRSQKLIRERLVVRRLHNYNQHKYYYFVKFINNV